MRINEMIVAYVEEPRIRQIRQGIYYFHIYYLPYSSQAASTSLSYISDTTGGLKYFTGDEDAAVGLQDALLATIQRDCDGGLTTVSYLLLY